MANEIIRNYSLYLSGKKVGYMTAQEYSINSNDEQQIGDGEVVGVSQGVATTGLRTDLIVPVAGTRTLLVEALLNKKPIDVSLGVVDGKIHKIKMNVQSAVFNTQTSVGNLTGTFNFQGGKPQLIG